jgi:molybdate transport system ATP-binding protein
MKQQPSPEIQSPAPGASGEAGLCLAVGKRLPHFDLEVSLQLKPGEVFCLVGPSGSGKTTLLRIIAGLTRPDSGSISLGKRVWVDARSEVFLAPRRREVGLVFQDYPVFPHLTVRKNVAFAAKDPALVPDLLDRFGIGHLADRMPEAISGGERQRTAVCQALARQPRVLLLDEPFSALDLDSRIQARRSFWDLAREQGICVLLITHDLMDAVAGRGRVAALIKGRLDPAWLENRLELFRQEVADLLQDPPAGATDAATRLACGAI